jgi:hypothetical protein
MAGAGYKLFNTGDVLTAAQVNTYLQEQAVMRFASAAARTTALSGVLAEGMVSYLMDTNAVEVYDGSAWVGVATGDITAVTAGTGISGGGTSGAVTITNSMATEITAAGDIIVGTGSGTFDNLPIGTTGQVLTADTTVSPYKVKWATTTSSSGLTLISTTTLSAVSSQSINSVFNSTYTNYLILFNITSASANSGSILMRLRASGTDATASNYFYGGFINYNGTVNNNYGTTTYWKIGNNQTGGKGAAVINLFAPNLASNTQATILISEFGDTAEHYSGNHSVNTAYDGVTIYTSDSTTITGAVSIYGYSK